MFPAIPRSIALGLASAMLAAAPVAYAQEFQPYVGQQGKDVVWVPTPDEVVERMLNMAQTKPEDYVIDLGAGDGKIAIAAAKKFGARSLGIEYNPCSARRRSSRAISSSPISPPLPFSPCTSCRRST